MRLTRIALCGLFTQITNELATFDTSRYEMLKPADGIEIGEAAKGEESKGDREEAIYEVVADDICRRSVEAVAVGRTVRPRSAGRSGASVEGRVRRRWQPLPVRTGRGVARLGRQVAPRQDPMDVAQVRERVVPVGPAFG
jgi:hypothetical protein